MSDESLPTFSVKELNNAISTLIDRGFPPLFFLDATVSRSQLKKGHLWLTLTDGEAKINAVVWASRLPSIKFQPTETDGVILLGKLNFWKNQATLNINVLDIKPSVSTVLKKFETVSKRLIEAGVINDARRRKLPSYPTAIAIMTSSPSSALADILKTARDRWPLTKLFVIPIPVQGTNASKIISKALENLSRTIQNRKIEALIIARGGGAREDLIVFDDEMMCIKIASFPIPVVTGIGHEDDLTVADLVADFRSATPTAAVVDLLPCKRICLNTQLQKKSRFNDYFNWYIKNQKKILIEKKTYLSQQSFLENISQYRRKLIHKKQILDAFSPEKLLRKGFCLVRDESNNIISKLKYLSKGSLVNIEFQDGRVDAIIDKKLNFNDDNE